MNKLYMSILNAVAKKPNRINIISSFLAAFAGVLLGFVIMIIVSPQNAFGAFSDMLFGPFANMTRIGMVVRSSIPIMLTGLSVAFAFRTGLFNIGASGQMMIGGVLAIYVGLNWTFLGSFHWVAGVIVGMLGGAAWGAIPGLLKAFRNVHEVVASIMLNYIALYVARLLVLRTMFDNNYGASRELPLSAEIPTWFLPDLFGGTKVNVGIFIALTAVILIHILLNRTTIGFELKSVGLSRPAAQYAGIRERKSIVVSMVVAGCLAGLAGALYYLDVDRRYGVSADIVTHGFTGIAIALLALSAPLGVILAAFFYASIYRGGWLIQRAYREEIIDIIIGFIIYFSALSLFTKNVIANYLRKKTKREIELEEKVGDV